MVSKKHTITVSVNGMRRNMHNEMVTLRHEINCMMEVLNGDHPFYSIEQQLRDIKDSFNTVACTINAFQCMYDESYKNDFDDQGDEFEIELFETNEDQ